MNPRKLFLPTLLALAAAFALSSTAFAEDTPTPTPTAVPTGGITVCLRVVGTESYFFDATGLADFTLRAHRDGISANCRAFSGLGSDVLRIESDELVFECSSNLRRSVSDVGGGRILVSPRAGEFFLCEATLPATATPTATPLPATATPQPTATAAVPSVVPTAVPASVTNNFFAAPPQFQVSTPVVGIAPQMPSNVVISPPKTGDAGLAR